MHQEVVHDQPTSEFTAILPRSERRAIERAAWLAFQGKHALAECARFAAGYHNLKESPHR